MIWSSEKRPAISLMIAGLFAASVSPSEIRGRKLGDTFDPMHAVVLRNENRSGKEFVEVDVRRRTGQFPVTDQAASRREQLQAGVAGGGADRIKNRGDASAPGIFVYRFTHILNGSIDGVDGPCGANGVHPVCRWRYRSL